MIATGSDSTADFNSVDISGTNNVVLDTLRTIGNLIFGDTDPTTPGSWTLSNNGNPANVLTLQTSSGTPTITTNADTTIGVVLAGNNGLLIGGSNTLTLTAANTYSGNTTVSSGTLVLSSGATLGTGGLTYSGTSSVVFNGPQTLSFLTSAFNSGNTLALTDTTVSLTLNQTSNTTFGGIISGGGNVVKNGSGTLTLSNVNPYTGSTTVNAGTLRLDLATASGNGTSGGTIQVLKTSAPLIVGGGTVTTIAGNGTGSTAYLSNFTNLIINPGATSFTQTRGSSSRAINTFTNLIRSTGGTISFTDVLAAAGTNNANTGGYRTGNNTVQSGLIVNGVIPYVTYTTRTDGTNAITSWFVPSSTSNGTTVNGAAYTAFTNSTASTLGTSTQNVDVVSDVAVPAGGATVNTMRFNDFTASRTLTLTGTDPLTVAAGGILVTNRVGNNTDRITGGVLMGAPAGALSGTSATLSNPELIIIDYNDPNNGSNAFFQIDSTIADNGGPTALTKSGSGTLILTNTANTYSGVTYLNGGIMQIAAGQSLGVIPASPVANALTFTSGTLQFSGSFTTLSSNRGMTLNALGGTLDTMSNSVSYGGIITGTGGLSKNGIGSLTLTGSNTYGGGTTINSGTLRVNNISGSATGSGAVTVSAGASLSGTGIVSGAVTLGAGGVAGAGGHIAPGNGVGTLTVGSITFSTNSVLDLEFNGVANDLIKLTNANGLTINGGGFNLYSEGTTNKFITTGTYNIIAFTGAIGGTGLSNWNSSSVLNPQAGLTYSFGTSGSFVTLTIAGQTAVSGTWVSTTGGSWATASNWAGNNIPNSSGATADFFGAITAPSTVTLDGNKTVGTLEFSNPNSYTITAGTGGSLIIDNAGFAAQIDDLSGSHSITAPIVLSGSSTVAAISNASDTLTLAGAISGTSSALTKTGAGTLALSASNSYGGGTTLNSGTTQIGNSSSFGTGSVTITGTTAVRSASPSMAMSNAFIFNSGGAVTVDTQNNLLTLSGTISGSGSLSKSGSGTLVVTASNSYGTTTITSGTVQVGTGGTNGTLGTGSVTNNGSLVFNRSDTATQSAALNGTGTLTQAGTGALILAAAGTMSGDTTVTSGTLQLGNSLSLQNSTVNLNSGDLSFGSLTAATLGGLAGSRSLALVNTSGTAVALTVGNNNAATTYSGTLSGSGSLAKSGTGTFFLTGTNTFTGTTSVNAGILEVSAGSVFGSNSNTISISANSLLHLNGGTLTANTVNLQGANPSNGGRLTIEAGSVYSANVSRITGNNQNSTSSVLTVNGGTVSLGAYSSDRDGTSSAGTGTGLIINGGTTTAATVILSTGNSWSNFTVNGGSITITGGTSGSGGFLVGNGSASGRGGNVTVTGGSLTYTGTDGMILNAASSASDIGQAAFNGGVVTLAGITLNGAGVSSGNASLTINGATVYLGNAGIVQNASGSATSSVTLLSGTLGATADWSSAASMTLNGIAIQAGDASNVAHNILLSGSLSGTGGFTKTGAGNLTLAGTNTYTGTTTVSSGILTAGTNGALGGGGEVDVLSTAINLTISTGVTDAISDLATLSLAGGGLANTADFGYLLLNGSDSVAGLILGGITQAPGTYGAIGSGAANQSNEYFGGTGILTVAAVPEPETWAMLLGGAAMLVATQRARRRVRRE